MHYLHLKFLISNIFQSNNGPGYLIADRSALVHAMTWRRTGDKPLHESMLIQFIGAYMRNHPSLCWNVTRFCDIPLVILRDIICSLILIYNQCYPHKLGIWHDRLCYQHCACWWLPWGVRITTCTIIINSRGAFQKHLWALKSKSS